jgi:hypothetical protein
MSQLENKKIIVHPIAGVDFQIVPDGVAITIRYYTQEEGDAQSERPPSLMQSLTVGLTATQSIEVANSLERAAQLIQSRTDASVEGS